MNVEMKRRGGDHPLLHIKNTEGVEPSLSPWNTFVYIRQKEKEKVL